MLCNITIVLWLFLVIVQILFSDKTNPIVVIKMALFPIMFLGAFWLIFSFHYAGFIKPSNNVKLTALILLPPVLCAWPIFTDKLFKLILVSSVPGEDVWGPLFYPAPPGYVRTFQLRAGIYGSGRRS
jgi:hydrogenase-4 membrane subunit HyfE